MPNHVTQQLSIHGADAPKVIERIAGTESTFDFNKVIPMPQELNIAESSDGLMGLAAISGRCDEYLSYQWVIEMGIRTPAEFAAYLERERPLSIELGRKYLSNQQRFGHATWYEWCTENWGTKWNAYSVSAPELLSDRATIQFDTAWSPAIPVIVRLSAQFPSVELTLRYFDEGWNFAGEAFFEAGRCADECFAPDEIDPRTRFVYEEVYGCDLDSSSDAQ
jgi:Ferredoxin-like domain in Api92-like protein